MDHLKRISDFQKLIAREGFDAVFVSRRGAMAYFTGAFIPWCSALCIPFLIPMVACILLVILVPAISTFLPNLLMG